MFIKKKYKTQKGLMKHLLRDRPPSFKLTKAGNENMVTLPNKSRSYSELLILMKSQFPDISDKKVARLIKKFCLDTSSRITFCESIKKPVVKEFKGGYTAPEEFITNYCRAHLMNKKGVDGFTVQDIVDTAGD